VTGRAAGCLDSVSVPPSKFGTETPSISRMPHLSRVFREKVGGTDYAEDAAPFARNTIKSVTTLTDGQTPRW